MRIFCIGRNYAAHAAELGNEIPLEPVVFMKPESSLLHEGESIKFPSHGNDLQHEAEIVVKMGGENSIAQIGIGLDLTLRDIQSSLKKKGLPWEKAKAFDGSAPLGKMVEYTGQDLKKLSIGCRVNGELRQDGNSFFMLFPIEMIITHLNSIWGLLEGDLIYTGTPKGIGPLERGDLIEVFSTEIGVSKWRID